MSRNNQSVSQGITQHRDQTIEFISICPDFLALRPRSKPAWPARYYARLVSNDLQWQQLSSTCTYVQPSNPQNHDWFMLRWALQSLHCRACTWKKTDHV
eukprot:2980657-Pleurochrysis_carterae.AAC.1